MADATQTAAQAAVYAPDGHVYMVPNSDLQDAMKNGGQLAVPMKAPTGDSVWVPTAHVAEAQKNGGKVDWSAVPEEHGAGFWKTYGKDIASGVAGFAEMLTSDPTTIAAKMPQMAANLYASDQARQARGSGKLYRGTAAAAQVLTPANIPAMEQAADQGDTKGVLAHAAAGTTMAAAPVLIEGGLKAGSPLASAATKRMSAAAPAIKSGAANVADVGAAVLDNNWAGAFSPRAKHIGSILGKMADALRQGKKITPEDLGPIPDDVAFPVTTPSDVPLEHIPEDVPAQATTNTLKESPLAQQSKQKIRAIGKMADALRQGKKITPEDLGPIPDDVAFPVTTPSDVPLEHIPEDVPAQATTNTLKESPLAQQSKQKIRASADAARSWKTSADYLDDRMVQEAMRDDLAQHGRNAYAEQRREFQANNSMDVPKWQRVAESKAADILEQAQKQVADILAEAEKNATTPVRYTKTPPLKAAPPPSTSGDLTSLLEQSIAAAKAKKGTK
jgi:hypothetical protein